MREFSPEVPGTLDSGKHRAGYLPRQFQQDLLVIFSTKRPLVRSDGWHITQQYMHFQWFLEKVFE